MATIIALVYPNEEIADAALQTAQGLHDAGYVKILETTIVTKSEDGKVEHKGGGHSVRTGLISGGVLGAVTGLIFTIPVAGLAAGAALGGYLGKKARSGGTDDFEEFRSKVDKELRPGGAALIVFGEALARDRVIQDMSRHGGELFTTDFSEDEVKEIQRQIDKGAS
jgi:uncharacterized membrane protein